MSWQLRKPFVLATYGTSLTTGRLSTFWPERLREVLNAVPEAVGPIIIQNMGRGSQNSDWGVENAPLVAALNPTHILTEGFAINDAATGIGVTQAQHLLNMQEMHDIWKARNPDVDITWQTMNGVATAGEALRPDLPDYYADEVTKAQSMGDRILDHYAGGAEYPIPPGLAGGWVKPLPEILTNAGDGLHPIWEGAVDTYMWPATLYWLRSRMAEYWGLAPPNPPEPPPIPDAFYEVVGAGGGGGGYVGGGGGAGGYRYGFTALSNLFGSVLIGAPGEGGDNAPARPGSRGGPSSIGPITAEGGGEGGGYSGGDGGDGGSGGGPTGGAEEPGSGIPGQGNPGGEPSGSANDGGGGGGGAGGPGGDGTTNGGVGGDPVTTQAPGMSDQLAGGGPAGSYNGSRPAYAPGQGPTAYGGGGRGGGDNITTGPGDPGGQGVIRVWYEGAPRATGGTITSFGGFTVHEFVAGEDLEPR